MWHVHAVLRIGTNERASTARTCTWQHNTCATQHMRAHVQAAHACSNATGETNVRGIAVNAIDSYEWGCA